MKKCVLCQYDEPCNGQDCPFGCYINKPEADNCWHIYKYMIYDKEHTLEDISKILGLSHIKVKQLLDSALEKVRTEFDNDSKLKETVKTILE